MRLMPLPPSLVLAFAMAGAMPGMAFAAPAPAAVVATKDTITKDTIELGDFMGRLRSIEVLVGGQRGTFLLDTGSGVSFATPQFAEKIGCKPWGQITGFRLSGERLDLPRCDGVALGLADGHTMGPVTIGVLDLKSLLPPDAPAADGSLALDAFDGQAFTLDLRAGTLVFETKKSLAKRIAGAVEVPIRIARHGSSGQGLGASARLDTAKGALWLELDSGSGAPVLLRDKVTADAGADPSISQPQPYSLALAGKDATGKPAELKLATRAIVRDMIHDGVLGMPVLVHWRLTFDLASDRLWVTPAE